MEEGLNMKNMVKIELDMDEICTGFPIEAENGDLIYKDGTVFAKAVERIHSLEECKRQLEQLWVNASAECIKKDKIIVDNEHYIESLQHSISLLKKELSIVLAREKYIEG